MLRVKRHGYGTVCGLQWEVVVVVAMVLVAKTGIANN